MKKLNFLLLVFLGSLLVLVGCENASDTVVNIPNVRVGCTNADSTDCDNTNANGATAYVQMTRSSCSAANFDPVATGSVTMTCDASGCDGTVGSWINPDTNESVTEILTGSMDICTTVDLDNSGSSVVTGSDLEDETSQTINSSATITIDSW